MALALNTATTVYGHDHPVDIGQNSAKQGQHARGYDGQSETRSLVHSMVRVYSQCHLCSDLDISRALGRFLAFSPARRFCRGESARDPTLKSLLGRSLAPRHQERRDGQRQLGEDPRGGFGGWCDCRAGGGRGAWVDVAGGDTCVEERKAGAHKGQVCREVDLDVQKRDVPAAGEGKVD